MRRIYCTQCKRPVELDEHGAYYIDATGGKECPKAEGFVPVHTGVLEDPLFAVEVQFDNKTFHVRAESLEALEEQLDDPDDEALEWLEANGKEVGWGDWYIDSIIEVKE